MAKKIDVSNAFYEGIFTSVRATQHAGVADCILAEIDHEEAIQFLDSSAGAPFRDLVSVDEDNRRLIGN